jgi:hypothetical protein
VYFPCKSHEFFPECLFNHWQGFRCTVSETCKNSDAYSLSDPSRNRIRPDTRLPVKESKNQHDHPAMWNFVHCLDSVVSAADPLRP